MQVADFTTPETPAPKRAKTLSRHDVYVKELEKLFGCDMETFDAKKRPEKKGICLRVAANWALYLGKPVPEPPEIYDYIDKDAAQKSIMADVERFEAMAAETVATARAELDYLRRNPGKTRDHNDPVFIGDTLFWCFKCDLIWPKSARDISYDKYSGAKCLICLDNASNLRNATVIGVVRGIKTRAKGRHAKKKSGKPFAVTEIGILQAVIDQGGYCGISRVVPLSFNRQSPFCISVEDIGGNGYVEGGWCIGAQIMNVAGHANFDMFKMICCNETLPDDYYLTDVPPPPKVEGATKNPGKGVGCRICWVVIKNPYKGQNVCKSCEKWRCYTMKRLLQKYRTNSMNEDKKQGRVIPADDEMKTNSSALYKMASEQEFKCAVTGFPWVWRIGSNCKRGEKPKKYSACSVSVDRIDSSQAHIYSNCRLVMRFFNPGDMSRLREEMGSMPPYGMQEPYSYSWTTDDFAVFKELIVAKVAADSA